MENQIAELIEKINQTAVLMRSTSRTGTLRQKLQNRLTTLLEDLISKLA